MTNDVRDALQTLIAGVQDGRSLHEMVEASPLAVLVANDHGSFVMANAIASALTGYSLSELRNLSLWQITPDVLEREADALIVAPDRVAITHEAIGCDHQRKRRRQPDRACDIDARAARRQVSHRAFDAAAAAAKRDRALFENPVPGYYSFFDHRRESEKITYGCS